MLDKFALQSFESGDEHIDARGNLGITTFRRRDSVDRGLFVGHFSNPQSNTSLSVPRLHTFRYSRDVAKQDNCFRAASYEENNACQETFCLTPRVCYFMDNRSISDRIRQQASGKCGPCENVKPFTIEEARERLEDLPGWILESSSIQKEFRFKSYLGGLDFAYSVGKIAELENHHPDLLIGWHRVRVVLTTHTIKGLSQNDFVMAAKSELEYSNSTGAQRP